MASIYAAPGVSYGAGAGTEGNPFHLKWALEQLSTPTDPEVILLAGTYSIAQLNNSGASGSKSLFEFGTQESERITIRGEGPGVATWKGTSSAAPALTFEQHAQFFTIKDIIFDGSKQTNVNASSVIKVFTQHGNDQNNIIFDGVTVHHGAYSGIFLGPWVNACIIRDCTFYDINNVLGGIGGNCVYGQGYNNTIRDCLAYFTVADTETKGGFRMYTNSAAIGVGGAVESHDNLIERCEASKAYFNYMLSGNTIVAKNNVSANPANTHFYLSEQPAGTNVGLDLFHNTLYSASGSGVTGFRFILGTYTGVDITNNGIYGPATAKDYGSTPTVTPVRDLTNLTSDPTFVSTTVGSEDYNIAESGAWDGTGTDLFTTDGVTTDKANQTRPQVTNADVGAYEFPDPADSPTVTMASQYSGNINAVISLSSVQAVGHGAEAIKAYLDVTGTLTLSIDGTGVTAKGGT